MGSTPAEAEAMAKAKAEAEAELEALAQAQAEAAAAGTTPPWVLLSCLPRLRTAGLFVKQVDLELAPPPSISVLTLSTCLFGDTSTTLPAGRRCPYVVAVDPSGGAILLSDDHVSDAGALPNPRRYILCNAVSRTASALLVPVAYGLPGSIGVVRRQGTSNFGGRLMVAVLTPKVREDMATLSYRTPKTEDSWTTVELVCMRPYNTKRWGNHGAVALGGSLWWIDLARGLLTSNVFARDKKVHFVHLPPGCALPETTTDDDILLDIHKRRCVNLSDGKLRFVEIHQPGGVATITLWTLNGVDGGHHWAS